MNKPREVSASIIMPAYNSAPYIAQSIDSVFQQTFDDWELIVIDDGSTDNTVDIVNGYGDRVRFLRQKNQGAAAARNYGAQEAHGTWLAFLDSDDIWMPDKLEKQMELTDRYNWSCTDSVFFGHNHDGTTRSSDVSPHTSDDVLSTLVVNNFIGTSTVLMKKSVFFECGGFDQSLKALQDWDLWLKVASKHSLGYVADAAVRYRVHAKSTSRSTRNTHQYHMEVIRRTFSKGGVGEKLVNLRKKALAESFGILAIISEDTGDFSFAFLCSLKSAYYQPWQAYRWKSLARIGLGWLRSKFRPAPA